MTVQTQLFRVMLTLIISGAGFAAEAGQRRGSDDERPASQEQAVRRGSRADHSGSNRPEAGPPPARDQAPRQAYRRREAPPEAPNRAYRREAPPEAPSRAYRREAPPEAPSRAYRREAPPEAPNRARPSAELRRGDRSREAVRGGQGYQRAVPRVPPERWDGRDYQPRDRRDYQRWDRRDYQRWDRRDYRRDYRRDDYRWNGMNRFRYAPPRVFVPGYAVPRRFYGPGGHYSAFFGWGSGYRFGNWYTGPVYGYVPPVIAYGVRRYYGDIRLKVRPRFAEVYVDGYYAGIVDDFDGVFQRLTVEVGRHEIEIVAPGYESRFYEVYVDPTRTVELHGDLDGPY